MSVCVVVLHVEASACTPICLRFPVYRKIALFVFLALRVALLIAVVLTSEFNGVPSDPELS